MMDLRIKRILKWLLIAVILVGVALLALRSYRALSGPPLQPWHTFVPAELHAAELDAADWSRYLKQEASIFDSVRAEVSQKLEPDARVPINRYFEQSPVYPAHFVQDWNRSYVLEPDGKPIGAVVLLHGLTDSPYSLRHVAKLYRDRGLCRHRSALAGSRHGASRADRRALGRLDGRDAPRHARRTPARPRAGAAAPGRLLERRRARDEVCAGRDRGPEAAARGPDHPVHADDRHHALRTLRRTGRPARRAAAVRERRVAERAARVQSIQVQLVPGQRCAPVVSVDRCTAGTDPAPGARRPARRTCRRC